MKLVFVLAIVASFADSSNGQPLTISTIAGGGALPAPALSASTGQPAGVAADASGNLYFTAQAAVFKIDSNGVLTRITVANASEFSGDNGPAINAQLDGPTALAADGAGNRYISLGGGYSRKIPADGNAGNGVCHGSCFTDGAGDGGLAMAATALSKPATSAELFYPWQIAVDAGGNVYVGEWNTCRVRKISTAGVITTVATVAGGGNSRQEGVGNLSIADWRFNTRVRRVSASGILTTIAGNGGNCCFGGDGGRAASVQLSDPSSVTIDAGGNVCIADAKNSRIRKVSPDGTITTVVYACSWPDDMWAPCGVAVDATDNLYTSDDSDVFRISPDGSKTKLADFLIGLAVDSAGNLFIAEEDYGAVRKMSPDGTSSAVAGAGTVGFSGDGGPATAAELSLPTAVAVDGSGNLYIADSGNRRIRVVSAAGVINMVVDASADLEGNLPASV